MPYAISWEPRGAVKTFTGHVSGAEVRQALVKLQNDPACDRLKYSINDFSRVESFLVGDADLLDFAALSIGARAFNAEVRVLVISDRPDVLDLVERYRQMGNGQVMTFSSMAEARAWLAVMGWDKG